MPNDYIRSKAIANSVTLNGKTIEQYPPATAYTPKNAATEIKNKIQYRPVDLLLVVILLLVFANIGQMK